MSYRRRSPSTGEMRISTHPTMEPLPIDMPPDEGEQILEKIITARIRSIITFALVQLEEMTRRLAPDVATDKLSKLYKRARTRILSQANDHLRAIHTELKCLEVKRRRIRLEARTDVPCDRDTRQRRTDG